MSKRNYKDFCIAPVDYNGVGEAPEYEPFNTAGSGCTRYGCQGDDCFFKQIESRIDGVLEFYV